MTEGWLDDVTGEFYEAEDRRVTYGLVAGGGQVSELHVHGETLEERPEAVRDALYSHVDAFVPVEDSEEPEEATEEVAET